MNYFAYSHITVITLLAFAAINEVEGEPWDVKILRERLTIVKNITLGIISDLAGAEGRVQTIKERIFSQNPTSQDAIEKHLDCLKTAYEYKWGVTVFDTLAERLPENGEADLSDVVNCCVEESSAYQEKMKEFPLEKCLQNLPPASPKDLDQLNSEIEGVFYHQHKYGIYNFLQKLYTTQLEVLTAY
uniref:Uncharacterized protein n=1 Tax=Trichobilharzia regenti TaxID=157069 RepID=A0AA85K287_TRIRE|nr:unnamed protein product [Trichobilharzia regenti]